METGQRKKLRVEVGNWVEPFSINDGHQTLSDISITEGNQSLVFDVVIRSIKCPRLLRACRLVCKAWNESACAVLRSMITAPVTIDDQYENRKPGFKKLRQLNESLKSQGTLPTPFRKVSFITNNFYFNSLLRNLHKELVLTELEIESERFPTRDSITIKLWTILKSQSRSLEVLKIHVYEDQEVSLKNEDLEHMKFLNLKKFHVYLFSQHNFCSPSYLKVLIRTIVHHSKLQLLHLNCNESKHLKELLCEISTDDVTTLQLDSSADESRVIPDLIRIFAAKPWHNLIRLNIPAVSEQEVTEIVSCLTESLEVLDTKLVKIPLDLLPKCPKLREMHCAVGYNGQILAEKFPSLKKFGINYSHPACLDFSSIVPHFGVVQGSIRVEQNTSLQHDDSSFCQFCNKWERWKKEFPTLKMYFQHNRVNFCNASTALRTIQKTFPSLRALCTYGFGRTIIAPRSSFYLQEDILKLPVDSITKEVFPFLGFLELESLDLHGIEVNPGLIISSLSKIPKLKYLRIRKHINLTSEIVRDYLGHLMEIAIWDCAGIERDGYRLPSKQRKLMREIQIPVVKFYCDCFDCNNPLCSCQDCHQYS